MYLCIDGLVNLESVKTDFYKKHTQPNNGENPLSCRGPVGLRLETNDVDADSRISALLYDIIYIIKTKFKEAA